MDKYEYNVKSDQIKKLYSRKDFVAAAKIADEIDWYRVKDNVMINRVADIYENTKQYEKAKEILLIAYERSPLGRQLAYKLTILSLRTKNFEEAEEFYQDFVEMSPSDVSQYLLKYRIAKAKGERAEVLIKILEAYVSVEMDERWQYELAKLYHEAGQDDKCIAMCNELELWFNEGKYVEKARELRKLISGILEEYNRIYASDENLKYMSKEKPEKKAEIESVDEFSSMKSLAEAIVENEAEEERKEKEKQLEEAYNREYADISDVEEVSENISEPEEPVYVESEEEKRAKEALAAAELAAIEAQKAADLAKKLVEEARIKANSFKTGTSLEETTNKSTSEYRTPRGRGSDKYAGMTFDEMRRQMDEEDGIYNKPDEEDSKIEIYEFDKRKEGKGRIGDELTKTAEIDIDEIKINLSSSNELYNTANIQEALAKSMEKLMGFSDDKVSKNEIEKASITENVENKDSKTAVIEAEEDYLEDLDKSDVSDKYDDLNEDVEEEAIEKVEAKEATENIIEEVEAKDVAEAVTKDVMADILEPTETENLDEVSKETVEEIETKDAAENLVEEVEAKTVENTVEEVEAKTVENTVEEVEAKTVENTVEEVEAKTVENSIEKVEAVETIENTVEEIETKNTKETENYGEVFEEEYPKEPTKRINREEINRLLNEIALMEKEHLSKENAEQEDEQIEGQMTLEEVLAHMDRPIDAIEEALTKENAEIQEETKATTELDLEEEISADENLEGENSEEDSEEDYKEENSKEEKSGEVSEASEGQSETKEASSEDLGDAYIMVNNSIPDNYRSLFNDFVSVGKMEEDIAKTLDNLINNFDMDGTSRTNNIIVTGSSKVGKTTLGLSMIKAANRGRNRSGRKVAKVRATVLNKRGVSLAMTQILGTDLIIEQAGNLMPNTVVDLMIAMKNYTEEMLILLEDDKAAIDRLLDNYPDLNSFFTNRLDIEEMEINDMLKLAKEYAAEHFYEIDEMGELALCAKLDDISGRNPVLSIEDIQEVVDEAIEHANRLSIKHLFGKLKKGKGEMGVLTEQDFL